MKAPPPSRLSALLLASLGLTAGAQDVPPARQQELVRVVRQDCGSCHGMRLTGGLGPSLTREALADKPVESMASTIYHGRPGTPMPGWRPMLSEAEARWIAEQLRQGFPEEPRALR
jgi:cytochrome c55X